MLRHWSVGGLVVLTLLSLAPALAHESGHGPLLNQRGKNGGALASVVLAVDAEKGRMAPGAFVSESWIRNGKLHVDLMTLNNQILMAEDAEAKLILFSKNETKPIIAKVALVNGSLHFAESAKLKSLVKGELIFNFNGARYVTDLLISKSH